MRTAYYSNIISIFLDESEDSILGKLAKINEFDLDLNQRNTWIQEVKILKRLFNLNKEWSDGSIILEYTIPRLCGRIDCLLLIGNFVFVIEFKIGESKYPPAALRQVLSYCLDLKYFHDASRTLKLIPVVFSSKATDGLIQNGVYWEDIAKPICCSSGEGLSRGISLSVNAQNISSHISLAEWLGSAYSPTPSIIEVARALYANHSVEDISKINDENAINLTATTEQVNHIIDYSKNNHRKSICFLTGVPGAGKTLVGLNIAIQRREEIAHDERAVFLSGNAPLVEVLQTALYDDAVARKSRIKRLLKEKKRNLKQPSNFSNEEFEVPIVVQNYLNQAIEKTFVQDIFGFRKEYLAGKKPSCRIAIFDEAQRCWTKEKFARKLAKTTGEGSQEGLETISSEPECLIDQMNKNDNWSVIVCLIGCGQEIHDGEAGIIEWFRALNDKFSDWDIYLSDFFDNNTNVFELRVGADDQHRLLKDEYELLTKTRADSRVNMCSSLHLAVSQRSFRSERISELANEIILGNKVQARNLLATISGKYPIVITRDLEVAKRWIKTQAKCCDGCCVERYGILASSGAKRIRAEGVMVPAENMDIVSWILGDEDNVNSSYFMEVAASEFKIQGLELDYALVIWEADYRYNASSYSHYCFRGTRWENINNVTKQNYLKNSYRVLLTRARQGFVIYVPTGNIDDKTRDPKFYDPTFEYLKSIGFEEI